MSTKTEILKLTKPAATDIVDISAINENMDIIDENLITRGEVQLLVARVDNLVANTGDSNSEIVDARLGFDTTSYSTLGEAIRTQANQLHTATESLKSADESIRTDLRTTTESLESADESIRTDLHTATESLESADESIRTDLHNKGIELDKKISSLRLYRDDEGYLCEMEE
jgi:seryl-tRNA synthetase